MSFYLSDPHGGKRSPQFWKVQVVQLKRFFNDLSVRGQSLLGFSRVWINCKLFFLVDHFGKVCRRFLIPMKSYSIDFPLLPYLVFIYFIAFGLY